MMLVTQPAIIDYYKAFTIAHHATGDDLTLKVAALELGRRRGTVRSMTDPAMKVWLCFAVAI
ncbi:hypothetical protein [Bradyrhizobium lablabi]|uniref:hypothetical protein n=1 Tax=Bradyrhizobium lablabi TaxID=722472 RepID=UPI0009A66941|nr:hypothetical protein [Bradyrhizobium lablabi]